MTEGSPFSQRQTQFQLTVTDIKGEPHTVGYTVSDELTPKEFKAAKVKAHEAAHSYLSAFISERNQQILMHKEGGEK